MADSKETIQTRLLSNVSSDYVKTEGSFFYDALMPVAIELETAYSDQSTIIDKGFADTSSGEYLDKIVAEQGLTRKSNVKATTTVTITGLPGATIQSGDKVASDTVDFIIQETKVIGVSGTVNVAVECEEAGTIGNVIAGSIKYFPVTLTGITSVTNATDVTNGYDVETDDSLRQRYYEKVRTPATSGNKYHYLNWAKEVSGVGDAKVFPLWNGNGTVKVIIINSNKRAADSALVTATSEYIEENRPIGATVTVESATEKAIDVSATLTLKTGYVLANVKADIEANLIQYFKDIAFIDSYVSYAKVGNVILDTEGVKDYSGLTINAGTSNISLLETEIPIKGVVTVA